MEKHPAYSDEIRRKAAYGAKLWQLKNIELAAGTAANCVFTCVSPTFGDVVLKVGAPDKEKRTEFAALREYSGHRFCHGWAADQDAGLLLLERVVPGTPLRALAGTDKRFEVFCRLYKGLHQPPQKPEIYPTYMGWVMRITAYMKRQPGHMALARHMVSACEAHAQLNRTYQKEMLLHGDLHHDNMLLNAGGGYTIIDPKGVVGDPLFDVPRYILNEIDSEITAATEGKIHAIIKALAELLGFAPAHLAMALYTETCMCECWYVESGQSPSPRKADFARKVAAAYTQNHLP